jgi:hypothetical protein
LERADVIKLIGAGVSNAIIDKMTERMSGR